MSATLLPPSPAAGQSPPEAVTAENYKRLVDFPRTARYRTVDTRGAGLFEALEVAIDVSLPRDGRYVVWGELKHGDQTVANQPNQWTTGADSRAHVSGAGPGRVTLRFSGGQIRASRRDGPCQLRLYSNGEAAPAGHATLPTPAFDHRRFGE